MQILIKISTLNKIIDILVDTNKNVCMLGNKKINIDTKLFATRLIAITSSWEEKMIDNSIIDGEEYSVIVKENTTQQKYVGKNKFPKNYYLFKNLISGVVNG